MKTITRFITIAAIVLVVLQSFAMNNEADTVRSRYDAAQFTESVIQDCHSRYLEQRARLEAEHNNIPILAAAKVGNVARIRELLQTPDRRRELIQQQDSEGRSALHLAAYFKHTDCIRELVQADANTNQLDSHRETPLHYAVQSYLANRVCIRENGNVKINQQFVGPNRPAYRMELHFLFDGLCENTINGNNNGLDTIQELLAAHADPSVSCRHNTTPLGMVLKTKNLLPRAPQQLQQEFDALITLLTNHHARLNEREAYEDCYRHDQQLRQFDVALTRYDSIRTDSETHRRTYKNIFYWTRNIGTAALLAAMPLFFNNARVIQHLQPTTLPPLLKGACAATAFLFAWVGLPWFTASLYDDVQDFRAQRISRSLQATANTIGRNGPANERQRDALRWILRPRRLPATIQQTDHMREILAMQSRI